MQHSDANSLYRTKGDVTFISSLWSQVVVFLAAVAIAAGGAISSGANYVGTKVANGKEVNFGELAFEMTVGAASNLLSFGVAGGTMKKAAGSVMNNLKKSFTSSLMKNTTRKVAGKVVLKTTKGIVKNVCKNIASDLAMTTVITGGTTLFTQGVERSVQ